MFLLLGRVLYVALLLVNAMAVLSEDRFLARIGWSANTQQQQNNYDQGYGNPPEIGMKAKLIELIGAVRTLMRIPLIGLNIVVIVYELLLGG